VADYLSDEEQLARLRGWWQQYGIALLVGALLVVVGVFGWRWYQNYTAEHVARTSDLYVAYQAAEGDARAALASQILEEGRGTAYPAFVLFDEAEAAAAAGEPERAEAALRRAVDVATADELVDTARLRLARVLFDLNRPEDALGVLGQVRGAGYLSLAAELQGDIHLSAGDRARAHASYVAAAGHLPAGEQRPVLEIKLADTADASGS
jgi:predicted negative regulator of RcsB-dependent stress response